MRAGHFFTFAHGIKLFLAEYPTLALVSKGLEENVVVAHLAGGEGEQRLRPG